MNSVDPDHTPRPVASDLDLYRFFFVFFVVFFFFFFDQYTMEIRCPDI